MLLDETRNAIRGHAVVPRAFGVDEHGGAVAADAQAADLAAVAGVWAGEQTLVLEKLLEGFPGSEPGIGCAALRASAKKHMALIGADAVFVHGGLQFIVH